MSLSSLTKAEAVYRETRWRVLTGSLPPGVAVNQAELAAEFGVSPTPVREALRRLESEGLVVFVAHAMVMVAPLDVRELDELYAIRTNLDAYAGELAAAKRTPEDVEKVMALVEPGRDDQVSDRFQRNRQFHRAVYEASHNHQLTALLDQLWDRTERYRVVLVAREAGGDDRYQRTHSDGEHRTIAAALAKGDAKKLGALLRAHVGHSHDLIRGMLDSSS